MEPDKQKKAAQIASLNEEMDAIHQLQQLLLEARDLGTHAARAEYQFRNERLEAIRAELAELHRV
jgi:hypothetical protein